VQKEAFSLHEMMASLMQMFAAECALNSEIQIIYDFDPDIPHQVINDRFRIEKVLLNLVSNAIKFTDRGSITLRTKLLEQSMDSCVISVQVQDTGVGIAPADQAKIFGQFTKLESSHTNRYKGYGLGLYIVKMFVEELGGHITVHSDLGKGTTFEFILNYEQAA
jgi:signal transduction histidine kinase